MNPRLIALALAAVIFAGGAALLARNWIDVQRAALTAGLPAAEPARAARHVLVAARDVPTGHFLKRAQLRWQAWPDETVAESYIEKSDGENALDALIGAVVRARIAAGEPVTLGRVVKPGDRGFLAAVLAPGTRAISVTVDATTGAAGFIFPDDRIDLILSHGVKRGSGEESRIRRASETILRDLRVLAIDQNIDDRDGKPALGKTATLEVTPRQAELITVAAQLGKLTLALRSLAIDDNAPPPRAGTIAWDNDVSRVLKSGSGATHRVNLLRGEKADLLALGVALAKVLP
ncbi:MAG: Flp pilus assembly protein CpaB [Alphaproteobacteria bacterium]